MDEIWNTPIAPVNEIIEKINNSMKQDIPDELEFNFKLSGQGAKLYYFVSEVLKSTIKDLSDDDVAKYLMRAGVESELYKIVSAVNYQESINNIEKP